MPTPRKGRDVADLSFGQYIKLLFGAAGLMSKHAASVPALRALANDAFDLWQSVVPPEPTKEPTVSPGEVVEKIRTGDFTQEEQRLFDRESQQSGGVG